MKSVLHRAVIFFYLGELPRLRGVCYPFVDHILSQSRHLRAVIDSFFNGVGMFTA